MHKLKDKDWNSELKKWDPIMYCLEETHFNI